MTGSCPHPLKDGKWSFPVSELSVLVSFYVRISSSLYGDSFINCGLRNCIILKN